MRRLCGFLLAAAALACPLAAKESETGESANPELLEKVHALIDEAGFKGELGIDSAASDGITVLKLATVPKDKPDNLEWLNWRWASVTKQVIAVLVMQEVARGNIDLDQPLSQYLPDFKSANADKITVRQLLRHQSGLPNPDSTLDLSAGSFYSYRYKPSREPLVGYCAGPVAGEPGGNWSYNNCDYMVAGALLQQVTGKRWDKLVDERIAKPLQLRSLKAFPTTGWTKSGTINGKPEPNFDLASFGAAGGLYGNVGDLLLFDRALMEGKLLPKAQLAEMWDGQPQLGYMALGQWVFEAPLKGCEKPLRIVERRGAIGGVQVRNFIVPEANVAVAAFTDRGEFDFGEIWQGSGFSFDLLSAAICTKGLSE
jgi:D-alanyl-D-alanine carboxypeptidase